MIITAEVAQKQAEKNLKLPRNWEKKAIRQLRKVERKIYVEAKKGKTSMKFYSALNNAVYETLRRNGYEVQECCNYDYEWIIISWELKETT